MVTLGARTGVGRRGPGVVPPGPTTIPFSGMEKLVVKGVDLYSPTTSVERGP